MGSRDRLERRLTAARTFSGAAIALLAACLGTSCGSDTTPHDRASDPSSSMVSNLPPTAWSVIDLPSNMKDRDLIAYAQIDDTHAFAFGGGNPTDGRSQNNGATVDLVTGETTRLDGPDVSGPLARTTAATETDHRVVALAGLQCAKFDPQYRTEDDTTTDACPPGPVTLVLYDAATDSWSTPSNAPYDFGQAFIPEIIGFVDGQVYIWVGVWTPDSYHDDYIRYDIATKSWGRIAAPPHPPSACLGLGQVIGLIYDGDGVYTNPRLVSYDASADEWTSHPVPRMPRSDWYGRECTTNAVVVRDTPAPHGVGRWAAYSLTNERWTELPAPSVRFGLGAPSATAGDTMIVWNEINVPGIDRASPASITVGPHARWTPRATPPAGHGGRGGVDVYAHGGTHVMWVDQSAILTADLAHLAPRAPAP